MTYASSAVIFPVRVVSPRYFANLILYGDLFNVNAFSYATERTLFIINSYNEYHLGGLSTQRIG